MSGRKVSAVLVTGHRTQLYEFYGRYTATNGPSVAPGGMTISCGVEWG